MRITQIRDDGRVNTLRTLKIEQLVEQMKVETKAQPVSKMREVLPFMLPGDKNDYVQKVPKLIPAAAFFRKGGITSTLMVCRIILPCSIAFLKAHCPHGSLRSALV